MGKSNVKQVGVICHYCGGKFLQVLSEWRRNQAKLGYSFCSVSCASSYKNRSRKTISKDKLFNKNNGEKTSGKPTADEFSPFRKHMGAIRGRIVRKPKLSFTITLEDLKEQWDKQNGICPYSGVKMLIGSTSTSDKLPRNSPYLASIDRIDSSKGYERGNIEFVSYMAQLGKNKFTREQFIEFCKKVTTTHQNGES